MMGMLHAMWFGVEKVQTCKLSRQQALLPVERCCHVLLPTVLDLHTAASTAPAHAACMRTDADYKYLSRWPSTLATPTLGPHMFSNMQLSGVPAVL